MNASAGSQGGPGISADPLSALRVAVKAAADRNPDRVALTDGAASRSYGELAQLLDRSGRRRRSGRRALAVGRSLADVEAILAESCAGTGLLLVDTGATAWEVERAEALFVEAARPDADGAADLALGLCSSGSSGLPKVVELDWRSLLLNAGSFAKAAGCMEGDVLWCTTPLAHLYCFGAGVLGGLLSGATVLLSKGMLEPEEFAGLARAEAPTLLLSVPFLFRRYLDTLRSEGETTRGWSGSLRAAIAAGEPVPAELIAEWRQVTATELRSHYGLTEGGQITLAGGGEDEGVGAPLEDVELRIGESGEIAVRRRSPGRPYRVIGSEPATDGWYDTGDLGYLDAAGNLHITGRADSRINVAGKKVDPTEVEEALRRCEGVSDCAVAGLEGPEGIEVVAFVCGERGGATGDGELRRELATRLSPHKLPRRFLAVAAIPRTLTGKVRRGELIAGLAPAPAPEPKESASSLELVRSEAAGVVLGHRTAAEIDPELSFKELGFDSLSAVSLCERLARASGLRVQATAVFDHPTPVALAAHLDALAAGAGGWARAARRPGFVSEPIAIVGMACRYPGGVQSPEGLWDLVAADADAISAFPDDRGWDLQGLYNPDPDQLGTSYAREGGFLDGAGNFDAEFFGISPREALAMDPQQRLLLEAAWEALEDAGIDPVSRRQTATAVFAGVMMRDYAGGSLPESAEGYLTTGLAESVVSGRVAYSLGLEGPAVTVNTACSSSLVAMHLACQSLRLDECSLALAGGVSVMATPSQFVEFSRQRGLARDGRCKSFADGADGTAWSEGVGLLVLERLSEARRNGHRILATIRGSAINQDGASNGLTAPNGPSQEQVIRQALANAGLEPGEVDAVEAHGTGTALGDPIEAGALLATYGQERERPLKLGSIKSNIGHSLAGAGVAGVIKTVMAMREGLLPKTLHVDQPSSKVDWEAGEIELLREAEPWQANGKPRRAGVSSFGISGTNAHLILEQGPVPSQTGQEGEGIDEVESPSPLPGPVPLLLSAKSQAALQAQAQRLASHLEANPELDLTDVAFSLATTRSAFEQRAVVIGSEREQLLGGLGALAAGTGAGSLIRAEASTGRDPAFLFGGQGSQHPGMALQLLERSPAFARHMRECEQALSPHVDWSLEEVLREEQGKWLDRLDIVQPALFAVMVSLARLWQEMGVRPSVVVGHSQGEIAAAHIAGGLSLDDAALIIARRAQAMTKLAGKGAMLSVSLSPEQIGSRLDPFGGRLSLAAINGPASLVISGEPKALTELEEACESDGVQTKAIAVDYAAHSAQIEELERELLEAFAPISPQSGEIDFHSTVTGEPLDTAGLDAGYWYRNLRRSVLMEPVLRALLEQGQRAFIEVSPHPVLGFGLQEAVDAHAGERITSIGTLRRDQGGPERFALSLAQAHTAGIEVDWHAFFAGAGAKAVGLPTYAFQRQRYWIESAAGSGDPAGSGQVAAAHPLLGAEVQLASGSERLFTGRLSLGTHPWLAEHAVNGAVLLPGAAFVDLALATGAELGAETLEELIQEAPLILPESGAVQIQLGVGEPDEVGRRPLRVHSRPESDPEAGWTRNASAILAPPSPPPDEDLSAWPPAGAESVEVSSLYDELAEAGFEYGPAFQGLRAAWRRGEELFAEVELGEEGSDAFAIHPALLDAALHLGFLADPGAEASLPFAWSGVQLNGTTTSLRIRLTPAGQDGFALLGADASGAPLISIGKLTLRPLEPGSLSGATATGGQGDALFRLTWQEVSPPQGAASLAEPWHCEPDPGPDPVASAQVTAERVLAELQRRLGEQDAEATQPLALITEMAVAAGEGESPDLAAAPLWGLLRCAQAEHPGRFVLIDSDGTEASAAALEAALGIEDEPRLAIREGRVLAARLGRVDPSTLQLLSSGRPWRLGIERKGTLENLELVAAPEASAPLGPGEVRIAVGAAGLNFRDVLIALGSHSGEAPIGGEGAGTVVEVGEEITDLAVGDRVFGLFDNAFGSLAVADRQMLTRLPAAWSQAEGAAVPIASLTALYGLQDLAGLRSGERVLIHAAAGGVGGFALQLARHLGAEVFATAHPSKWDSLRQAGLDVEHIASSRDLDFHEQFLAATGYEGLDVVLNSLTHEFVDASLDLLPRGGRFLEIGKADIRDAEQVAASHPGVAYRAYDLFEAGARRIGEMLDETLEFVDRGALSMPAISNWDVRRGEEAFRFMSQGRHRGKIVLSVPQPPDPAATTLITGATGTLGSLVARHMVEAHGARNLVLVSRRGAKAPGAGELKAELEDLGATVQLAACDVAERDQVQALIDSIPPDHPLKTVIHAAGALDDGVLEALSPERLQTVLAPKARGAWNLHELTKEIELSQFVLFSSVAATLGSAGQANYAAANAFLDALATQRQAEGLPATAIAWGLWASESAMSAHLGEADLARMRRAGMAPIEDAQGLALLDAAIQSGEPTSVATPLELAALRSQARAGTLPPLFAALVRTPTRRGSSSPSSSLAQRLANTPEAEREALVLELVRSEAATVLGHSGAAAVEPSRAFKELGFDSLAAVELRNRLKAATGLRLPSTLVFDQPSVAAVAAYLREQVSDASPATAATARTLASEEPIAIVGMACRYPGGAGSPRELWELVAAGEDGISAFPTDRGWDLERLYDSDPDVPGTSYAREGGFLVDADRFDAAFFGIGPREALATDPQQRLLLEAAWEALEQAGVDPSSLKGKSAGVFSGISSSDYGSTLRHAPELEGHAGTGNLGSVLSGRIAYQLGLEGPAITVDTACSSSLVAMHLAAGSLRNGECSLALAGGVTVLSTPDNFIDFSRQRGLAPDGRCKSFAEAADGTGFSEGVGLLVLERLSEAQRNGHQVLATIKGSAVNQDGASNGLTAPNGPSQERVIRQALANAGLKPQDVDMVEAHGTGTTLGDPIEAGALLATYGQEREAPLKLGSIKSNIGHTQAAAGVAGVIKAVMAMREGILPKTLHAAEPSTKVEWEAGEIELLSEACPWQPNGRPRRAGVSSFGISGTNAHLILEEAPVPAEAEPGTGDGAGQGAGDEAEEQVSRPLPFVLSAKSQPALKEQAQRLAAHLRANPELDPTDVAYSLATTRAAFEHRAVAIGSDREQLLEGLGALAQGSPSPGAVSAKAASEAKLAYLLTGQGSQRVGMGKGLHETYPTYSAALDQACAELDRWGDRPLAELLFAAPASAEARLLDHTTYAQPALFATEVALYRLLESWGLHADLLCGHSIGEITAAHIAGVFDLPDAARLVAARGRLMGELPTGGAMVAIEATEAEAMETIEGKGKELAIASINGPSSVVLSGAEAAIEAAGAEWKDRGRKTKRLAVSHAFHSPLMEPMLERFEAEIAELTYNPPTIAILSNSSGEPLSPEQATDPAYWVSHVREPVRFMDGVRTLVAQGASALIELGPDPVLIAMARECLEEEGAETLAFAPALREGYEEPETLSGALAQAHATGIEVDWEAFFAGTGAKAVALPTYAFQRERYWIDARAGSADPAGSGQAAIDHPLLGAEIQVAGGEERLFTGRLSLATHPWLAEHAVNESVLLPGAAFVDLALATGAELGAGALEELIQEAPLVLPESGAAQIQIGIGEPDEEGRRSLRFHSRPDGDPEAEWTRNASAVLVPTSPVSSENLSAWPPPGAEPIELDSLYDELAEAGFEYGPSFQGLRAAWRRGEELFAEVEPGHERSEAFAIDPALLDAALHLSFLAEDESPVRLPFAWSGVHLHSTPASLRVRLTPDGDDGFALMGADSSGTPAISIEKLSLRPLDPSSLPSAAGAQDDSLLRLRWQEVAPSEGAEPLAEVWHCEPESGPDPLAASQATAERVLAELQRRLGAEEGHRRLALVTRRAVAAQEGEIPDLASAPLWGLLRSAQAEHPGRFALIDSDGSEASGEALEKALACEEEPQLALREGRVLAARLEEVGDGAAGELASAVPWRLGIERKGTLENLALVAAPQATAPLGAGEVRVAVGAAGLNFRDVLIALGSYPGEAQIGSEGAGTVVEVGDEVTDLDVGERVFGLIDNAFGPLAIAERQMLARLPAAWSQAEGAAVPIASLTALYGLQDLAGLRSGERVLIHAAAGGVGGFALQLARHLGAEVFATAHPSKWDSLRQAGLDEEHIASSRDLDFKQKFLAASGGEGMDLVLDSLAHEFVDASLDLLPRGGRFLEIGKADIRDAEQVAASHPGVAYRAYDLIEAGPERIEAMLGEVVALFERKALSMPAISNWDVRRGEEAFRFMSQGRHRGKIVLSVPQPPDPAATTLISGAGGTLGSLVARHMVEAHGARNLILASRRGAKAPGAAELKAELEELGATVQLAACDVAERDQVQALIDSIPSAHPLKSVIHAAGVLDDGILDSLTPERLQTVFAPKARGAWNLHELTKEIELSQFVLFSSVAATLGSAGQANYAAANAFLDALAIQRQAEGLPATAIAWGLWASESAMTARLSEADRERMRRAGMAPIEDAKGLELFDEAISSGEPATVATPLEAAALRSQARSGELPALFRTLVRSPARRRAAGTSLAQRLANTPEAEREALVLELVRGEAATVLGHSSAAAVEPSRAFKELGFDSLAAVELRNRLKEITGLRLPSTLVFDQPSVAALSSYLCEQVDDAGQKAKVAARTLASEEPIAIVGMACRYPGGASTPEQLWALLTAGRDAIGGFPTDRGWDLERLYDSDPDVPGTSYAREGGFLYEAGDFDPGFFGIAPREAAAMDPQQRLLLEASWEALESAGIDAGSLRGSAAGVFAGISSSDYAPTLRHAPELEGHAGTGNLGSVLSGRIAYQLGLEGPAITVDTACSSSLVAMHLAAQSLRSGECNLALAGGVTVFSTPGAFVEFSRQRGLAPDGRCKSFAEGADGVGWAEGVGLLVLERLSEAQRNGHQVLATIKGSAVNQDGASNGLTAPNGPSQERVIRQALANAGLKPQDVDMVEAHGTGTTLGDPIEAGALLATYGQEREAPLKLGSIKSNIGHTQAAAGVAGVIKAVMAMREGILPKTLHAAEPSTKVEWEAGEIELLSEACPWQPNGRPRRAGVSSFGISGTNAHLILEEAPVPAEAEPGTGDGAGQGAGDEAEEQVSRPLPFVLSAKSQPALKEQAQRLAAHLRANPELDPTDVAYSLATTRAAFEHRAVAIGSDREQLLEGLGALGEGAEAAGLCRGQARAQQRPAMLFGGQGSQHPGMALELLESSAAFAAHMRECERALDPHVEWSLEEVLREGEAKWLDRLDIVQPALFAVMVSLARLWGEMGVRPALVAGHSQGEIAAAHIAGGLSLDDAALVIARRAGAMAKLAGKGGMLSLSLGAEALAPRLEPFGARLALAAINGPASLVVSGEPEALVELKEACEADGVHCKPIAVDYAAHSAQIEDLREELLEAFEPISPQSGEIPMHSTVTGEPIDTAELGPEYWYRNLRQTVLLEPVFRSLLGEGQRTFIEVSPHPVLGFGLQEAIDAQPAAQGAAILATLHREHAGPERFALSHAEAHANGVAIDWEAFFAPTAAKAVALPTYAFQRERYWIAGSPGAGDAGSIGQRDPEHPLLGAMIEDPAGEGLTFTASLSLASHPWLADHAVAGTVLLPGTAFLELALHAGELAGAAAVEELTLIAPLIIPEAGAVQVQLGVGEADQQGRRPLQLHSRPEADPEAQWVCNASGTLASGRAAPGEDLSAWPPRDAEPIQVGTLYEELAEAGFEYGPAFQGLSAAWRLGEDLFAEVEPAQEHPGGFAIHPALLDAALHASFLVEPEPEPRLPFAWSGVSLHGSAAGPLRIRLSATAKDGFALLGADVSGATVISIERLTLRPLEPGSLAAATRAKGDSLFRLHWQEVRSPEGAEPVAEPWHCEPQSGSDPVAASQATAERVLAELQRRLAAESAGPWRLALITRGAVAAVDGEAPDLVTAPLWGLLRSAQVEHPDRFCLIDTDGSSASGEALRAALAIQGEPQLAIREGRVLAARLGRVELRATEVPQPPDSAATTLISGATGTLGALIARHLVEARGVRNLILTSRRGARAPGAKELKAELEGLGASVRLAACDVAERSELAELIASIPADRPLRSVIHAAGVLDDGILDSLTPERLQAVFAPKARGAWNLHERTKEMDLSQFVLFSSVAATLGAAGQGNYAAANTFLDALAQRRRSEGLAASSIGWGLWASESAMSAHLAEADLARMRRAGMAPLSDAEGLALFDAAIASGEAFSLATPLEAAALRSQANAGELPALLSGLVRSPARRPAAATSLARRLAQASETERQALVLELVRSEAAIVLGHSSAEAIEPGRAFKELGFDSLSAVELRNRLSRALEIRLPATSLFDYPSPLALVRFLLTHLSDSRAPDVLGDLELDRLEALFASSPSDAKIEILNRLRSFLTRVSLDSDTESDGSDLDSVSDDEVIALIDEEFGSV